MLTLSKYSQYTFLVSFVNFVGLSGSATFTVETTTTSGA